MCVSGHTLQVKNTVSARQFFALKRGYPYDSQPTLRYSMCAAENASFDQTNRSIIEGETDVEIAGRILLVSRKTGRIGQHAKYCFFVSLNFSFFCLLGFRFLNLTCNK